MQQTLRPLVILTALAGSMFVIAGGQLQRAQDAPLLPTAVETVVPPQARPQPSRAGEHRKLHRPAPKSARPKWQPIPGVRPIPPIAKPEKKTRAIVKKRATTNADCVRAMRERDRIMALPLFERLNAANEARANSGMTQAQINDIRRRCGV